MANEHLPPPTAFASNVCVVLRSVRFFFTVLFYVLIRDRPLLHPRGRPRRDRRDREELGAAGAPHGALQGHSEGLRQHVVLFHLVRVVPSDSRSTWAGTRPVYLATFVYVDVETTLCSCSPRLSWDRRSVGAPALPPSLPPAFSMTFGGWLVFVWCCWCAAATYDVVPP